MFNGDNVLLHYSIHANSDPKQAALYRLSGPVIDSPREATPSARRSAQVECPGMVAAARGMLAHIVRPRALRHPAPAPCC